MLRSIVWMTLSLVVAAPVWAQGPEPILLWPDGAPGAMGTDDVDKPSIRIYPADEANRTGCAVVICPGGGYGALAFDHEGHQVAKWFNTIGVTGIVVKYRLGPKYHHPAPLQDASRAIRYVRAHADELKIDPQRVGIMGFSAGGHLASTVSTHYDSGDADSADVVAKQSSRPNFAILCYPVISMKSSFGHTGSKRNLLGNDPPQELVESMSNETQITKDTPPTFLFHTREDTGVPVQNSLVYFRALIEHGVSAELHVYQQGPHGVGLAPKNPVLSTWTERLADWLKVNNFLAAAPRAAVSGTIQFNGEPLRWGTIAFEPQAGGNLPVAWAMVSRGNYRINAVAGPVVGPQNVTVLNWGSVEPRPTLEDSEVISAGMLTATIVPGTNEFAFDLKAD